jgi:hypothetical protein
MDVDEMAIVANTLLPPKAPNLPVSPAAYDAVYQEKLNNALRIYFNQLDNTTQTLLSGDTGGGKYLRFPYGAFHDTTTQSAANTTTAYAVTFDTTDYSNGVVIASGSHLKVTEPGIYNLQFSVQLDNTTNAPQDVDIWVSKNGTNIPASNSRFGLAARKAPADPFHTVGTVNVFSTMNTDDYLELYWCTSDIGTTLKAYAAGATPTRPLIPSVIATLSFVSALTA